jgi:hypothetical protein
VNQPLRLHIRDEGVDGGADHTFGNRSPCRDVLSMGCRAEPGCTLKQLHNFVKVLRRKIEPELSRPRYIINSHGVGYFMPMEVDSTQVNEN